MPGATIEIDPEDYPKLGKIEDGEKVTLKVVATKGTSEDGMVTLETESIEQTDVNPAKKALKGLKKQNDLAGKGELAEEDPELEEDAY